MAKTKIPKPTKRSDGRYMIRYIVDGKRKSVYGKTLFEVKSKYSQKILEKEDKERVKIGNLEDCIYEWMVRFKLNKVKNSTYDRMEVTYKYHIKGDAIGKMQVHDISSVDLQEYIDRKSFPDDERKLLSISSIKKIKELLSGYFRFAFSQHIITFNPMLAVELPLEENLKKKTKIIDEVPHNIIESLYADCNMSHRYNTAFIVLINTGMRIGELIALKWDDVDFNTMLITVSRNVSVNKKRNGVDTVSGRVRVEGTTKTTKGNRIIPMNKMVVKCLNMIMQSNQEHGIITDYVISTSKGTRASARNIQRALDEWLARNKFKHYNLHALRHTFGSLLIRSGIDVKVVSELMGHAKVQTTYNIYIHVIQEQKIKAIQKLNDLDTIF